MSAPTNKIYTIGHSTRNFEEFLAMLQSFQISLLADVRRFPGSRRYPQYNKENLKEAIEKAGLKYVHFESLGGRRKVNKDTKNTRWHNTSFRGYADYMETETFEEAMNQLQETAQHENVAYMCSEAVWWRCHRALISDYLKAKEWQVLHIMGVDSAKEHSYTAPAIVENHKVRYHNKSPNNEIE